MKNIADDYPLVSVIIPCFNAKDRIVDCIRSVRNQTYPNLEILVYDDRSLDGTDLIIKTLAHGIDNIQVELGDENKGAGYSRERLLKRAKGKYIAFLDADDTWHPEKIEKQVDVLESGEADICSCRYEIVAENGSRIGERHPPVRIDKVKMHLANWIPMSMTVFRADLEGAREMPHIRKRQDYAFWLSLFRKNVGIKCATVEEVLGAYLRSKGSLSSSSIENFRFNYVMFRQTQRYSVSFSALLVMLNVITRIFRT